jgi:site-specific DNA-methyltransferase (adenine-specific)
VKVEHIGDATLYLGDCLDFMQGQKEHSFDLCIADPWYGIGMTRNDTTGFAKRRFRVISMPEEFDDSAPPPEHFDEIRRVSKEQIIWGGNYFLDYLGNCRAPIIWDKGTGANYFADGEMAWTSFKTGCLRIFKHQWCGAFKDSERREALIHPCQKPVALYKWLLDRYARPGMSLFDPYLGSAASVVAAFELGYSITACEINPTFFDNACKRIELAWSARPRLFDDPKPEPKPQELFA